MSEPPQRRDRIVVLAGTAALILVVGGAGWVTLKSLPDCWRENPTWSVWQCLEQTAREFTPFAPPPRPIPKPVIPPAPQLTLNWTDNSEGQAGVYVERRLQAEGTFTRVAELPAGQTSYVDATVATGTTYCYRVQAYGASGQSSYSPEACGTTAAAGLTVTVTKSGSGTVTSSPDGISCGSDCEEAYAGGTIVTLSASAASGSVFSGWSGGGCSGTAPCTLVGNAPVAVAATFAAQAPTPTPPPSATPTPTPLPPTPTPPPATPTPASYTLSVARSGSGTVVSAPSGISCGKTCSAPFAAGQAITLSALPSSGWRFSGWTGAGCEGTAPCTVALGSDQTVSAQFVRESRKR